jgi:hypothetical protein
MHRRPALVKWLAINRRASTSFTALVRNAHTFERKKVAAKFKANGIFLSAQH